MKESLEDFEELRSKILGIISKHTELPEEIRKKIVEIYIQLNELIAQNRIYTDANYKILEEGLQNSIIKSNELYKKNGENELGDIIYLLNQMKSRIEEGTKREQQEKEGILGYYQDEEKDHQLTEGIMENINQEIARIRIRILNRMKNYKENKENMQLANEIISGFIMRLRNNSTEKGKIAECIRQDKSQLATYIDQAFIEYEIECNKTPHQKFAEAIKPESLPKPPNINTNGNSKKEKKEIEDLPDNVLE